MVEWLVRKFIPEHDRVEDGAVRERYGMFSGIVGIICNLCLFAAKLLAGILSGAISIIADAFNNLSDAGTSIVTLIGFKLASRPADSDHPFGHGRIEYITGLFIAMAIIFVGVELFRSSAGKIAAPDPIVVSPLSIGILTLSIGVKLWLAYFNRTLGVKIKSAAMQATAMDSFSDCVATAVVIIGIAAYHFTGVNIDGYAGIAVSLFIAYTGVNTVKETISPLLGQAPEPELVRDIERFAASYDNVIGVHDLIIHDYGPGRRFVSLHVEIPSTMDMLEAHELIDKIEADLHKKIGCEVIIHMDPIIVHNEHINKVRRQMTEVLASIDATLSLHDFRMTTRHKGLNLIFDVVVPYCFGMTDKEVREAVAAKARQLDARYNVVIKIDRFYV